MPTKPDSRLLALMGVGLSPLESSGAPIAVELVAPAEAATPQARPRSDRPELAPPSLSRSGRQSSGRAGVAVKVVAARARVKAEAVLSRVLVFMGRSPFQRFGRSADGEQLAGQNTGARSREAENRPYCPGVYRNRRLVPGWHSGQTRMAQARWGLARAARRQWPGPSCPLFLTPSRARTMRRQ